MGKSPLIGARCASVPQAQVAVMRCSSLCGFVTRVDVDDWVEAGAPQAFPISLLIPGMCRSGTLEDVMMRTECMNQSKMILEWGRCGY